MGTRKRTNMSGLILHTNPDGHSSISEESKLLAKFKKGTITKEEQYRLASFMVIQKKKNNTPTEVKIFGVWKSIATLGISVDVLKAENFELR